VLYNTPREDVAPYALGNLAASQSLDVRVVDWVSTNYPLWERLSAVTECCINLGIVDCRYAEYLVEHPQRQPSTEPSLVLQSNVVFDPSGFVRGLRPRFPAVPAPALVGFLVHDVRTRLAERMPTFLEPHPADEHKAAEGEQILWVAHAVRCIRDAAAAVAYSTTGKFVYRKQDVLHFLKWLPAGQAQFAERLYQMIGVFFSASCQSRPRLVLDSQDIPSASATQTRRFMVP
jgi:hypothetical protein